EEVGYVSALADFLGQLDDLSLRNEPTDVERTLQAGHIEIEAEIHVGNRRELRGPVGPEDAGPARRRHRPEALSLEREAIELAFANNAVLGLAADVFPAVELAAAAGGRGTARPGARSPGS